MRLTMIEAFGVGAALLITPARAQTPREPSISPRPPAFRVYDVDRRERWLRRTLGSLAGTAVMPRGRADAELARLDRIRDREHAMRARHGGSLTLSNLRVLNAELTDVSRQAGLR